MFNQISDTHTHNIFPQKYNPHFLSYQDMATPNSSETADKPHPYNVDKTPGVPVGAFEARKTRSGLYIRVDMPGVPNDIVKVVKYNETRTVTFLGKAPPIWAGFDSPETRVYGGYVVLDRDIADLDFVTSLQNGCLRLYFPRCDGSLHFLSRPSSGAVAFAETQLTSVQDEDDLAGGYEEQLAIYPYRSLILHEPQNNSGMRLLGGCSGDINPYQLSGVKGVYEHRIVTSASGEHLIYVRLDVPDTQSESAVVSETPEKDIHFAALASKKHYYSRFDETARAYYGALSPTCNCCNFNVVKFDSTSGVLRFLVRKTARTDNTDNNLNPGLLILHGHERDAGSKHPWIDFRGPIPAIAKVHPHSSYSTSNR